MEELVLSFRDLIDRVDTRFVRYLHNEIDWNSRLIAILGTRGVGKTTLLLQHIKQTDAITSSLYVTADDLYFSRNTLAGLAQQFYQQGGKYLYIDEIHKYKGWSQEIKNIYSDAVAEAVEMEYDIESKWIEEYQTLEITYTQTGTVENWVIYEREVY